jgi:MYXO-CTERM domain-containing protein
VAVLLALALVTPPSAGAHLSVTPAFLKAGDTQDLVVTVHNDRDETMTGFELTVPADFRIVSISTTPGWSGGVRDRTATWTGGALAADTPETFELAIEAPDREGTIELEGAQLYPGSDVVDWPVAMTVVPDPNGGSSVTTLSLVAVLGLFALVAVGVAAVWRRRARPAPPLQD